MKISGYMYKLQDLTPISGHFRTNFKISGISGQRPGLDAPRFTRNFLKHQSKSMPQSHQPTAKARHNNPL